MTPYLTREFGNPSSSHAYGAAAHGGPRARPRPGRPAHRSRPRHAIVFTGSGSEANTLALRGAVLAAPPAAGACDHPGHRAPRGPRRLRRAERCTGLSDLPGRRRARPGRPLRRRRRASPPTPSWCRSCTPTTRPAPSSRSPRSPAPPAPPARCCTCDAAQAAGKIDVDVMALGVDLLTVVGHKMYAPKGIAALYVRRGVRLHPLICGGGQEHGLRAGTENVAAAVGFGAAADLAAAALATATRTPAGLRDRLEHRLAGSCPAGCTSTAPHRACRTPSTSASTAFAARACSPPYRRRALHRLRLPRGPGPPSPSSPRWAWTRPQPERATLSARPLDHGRRHRRRPDLLAHASRAGPADVSQPRGLGRPYLAHDTSAICGLLRSDIAD